MDAADVKGLQEYLKEVGDPRRDYGNRLHRFIEILVIALCSVIWQLSSTALTDSGGSRTSRRFGLASVPLAAIPGLLSL